MEKNNHVYFEGFDYHGQEVMIGLSDEDITFYGCQLYPKEYKNMFANLITLYSIYEYHINRPLHGSIFIFGY